MKVRTVSMSSLSVQRLKDFRRADDAAIFGSLRKRRKYGLRISRYDDLTDKEKQIYCLVMPKLPVVDPIRRFMFTRITFAPTLADIKDVLSKGKQYDYAGLYRILFEEETLVGWCLTHPVVYRRKEAREIVEEYYREIMDVKFKVFNKM